MSMSGGGKGGSGGSTMNRPSPWQQGNVYTAGQGMPWHPQPVMQPPQQGGGWQPPQTQQPPQMPSQYQGMSPWQSKLGGLLGQMGGGGGFQRPIGGLLGQIGQQAPALSMPNAPQAQPMPNPQLMQRYGWTPNIVNQARNTRMYAT